MPNRHARSSEWLCSQGVHTWPESVALSTRLPVKPAKLVFGFVEDLSLGRRELLAGPVDVEVEHGHCRSKRRCLPSLAFISRLLKGECYFPWVIPGENACFEIEGIAGFRDLSGPKLGFLPVHSEIPESNVQSRCLIPGINRGALVAPTAECLG